MLSVHIIGAGAVGQTLGYLWTQHHVAKVHGIVTQSLSSAQQAVGFIGAGDIYLSIRDLPSADLIVLTTPDHCIGDIVQQLLDNPALYPDTIICHCSGTLTSDCLVELKSRGFRRASIHPMMSFRQPQVSVKQFANTPCAVEGDVQAVKVLTELFTAIGGVVYPLKKENKILYHVAAVFASNYQVTLAQKAYECFLNAGIEEKLANQLIKKLMETVISNLSLSHPPKQALTGPISRGDKTTVAEHLKNIHDPNLQDLYRRLGMETLNLTNLNAEVYREIKECLES